MILVMSSAEYTADDTESQDSGKRVYRQVTATYFAFISYRTERFKGIFLPCIKENLLSLVPFLFK